MVNEEQKIFWCCCWRSVLRALKRQVAASKTELSLEYIYSILNIETQPGISIFQEVHHEVPMAFLAK